MPILTRSNVGTETIVSGMVNILEDQRFIPDPVVNTVFLSQVLACDQLPHLSFYVQRISGAAAVSILPQYAIRFNDGGALQQMMNLPGGLMPANNNLLLTFNTPANYIGMQVTIGPDPAGVQVRLLIVCQAAAT